MKLYVVRHGETVWNELHKVQGTADIPLAEKGIELAEKTGEALKEVPFDLCITSPLVRARRTAELILEKQPHKVPVIDDKRIQEINFGELEGVVCFTDEHVFLNEQMEKFFNDPWKFERPKNGENISDILARTKEFWEEVTGNPDYQDKTILIAHTGCACAHFYRTFIRIRKIFWHGHVPPNCGVNIVEVKDGEAVLSGRRQSICIMRQAVRKRAACFFM